MTDFTQKGDKNHPSRNEGRMTARTRRKLEPLLQNWHGRGEGEAESMIMGFLPQTRSLAETLDHVMAKTLPAYLHELTKIQEHWAELAGSVAAVHTSPIKLYQGILSVEVSHPAYRTVLMSKKITELILDKIAVLCGDGVCTELRLVPAGGRAESMKYSCRMRSSERDGVQPGSQPERIEGRAKNVKTEKKLKKTSE